MKFLSRFTLFLSFFMPLSLFAQTVEEHIVNLVADTVYEVVIEKPQEDHLQYEQELPLSALNFNQRTDQYYSIGTAFAIEGGRFLSASHVFSPSEQSQIKQYYIRTKEKQVFPINNVYQFSDSHDFIVFDVDGYSPEQFLELEANFKLNSAVYAVGNALGDGIVIRDGLLTSTTLEAEAGKWEWLRFSAPASQGNSGGPLLDSNGKVIGLILMKSHNENLNFALPVSEILNFPPNTALSSQKVKYSISILNNYIKPSFFKTEIKLPLKYSDFNNQLKNEFSAWTEQLISEIKSDWEMRTFPYGKGSEEIFLSSGLYSFPGIIAQRQDGGWGIFSPQNIKSSQLDNGGTLDYGKIADFTLFKLKKNDNQSTIDLYSDSKVLSQTLLQGLPFYREVAGQNIRITSFGEAKEFNFQKDRWGRVWISNLWELNYSDSMVILYALPVPDGLVGIIRADSTHAILNAFVHDFNYISDFVITTYNGSFQNWKEFFEVKEVLPTFMKASSIRFDEQNFSYADSLISFSQPNEAALWNEKSTLKLGLSFESSDKNVFLAPKSYLFNDQQTIPTSFEIKKILNPNHFKVVSDGYKKYFNQVSNLLYPYNGEATTEQGITRRSLVASNKISKDYFLLTYASLKPNSNSEVVETSQKLMAELFNPRFFALLTPVTDTSVIEQPKMESADTKVVVEVIEPVRETPETVSDENNSEKETTELSEKKNVEKITNDQSDQVVSNETSDKIPEVSSDPILENNSGDVSKEEPSLPQTPAEVEEPSLPINEILPEKPHSFDENSTYIQELLKEYDISTYVGDQIEDLLW